MSTNPNVKVVQDRIQKSTKICAQVSTRVPTKSGMLADQIRVPMANVSRIHPNNPDTIVSAIPDLKKTGMEIARILTNADKDCVPTGYVGTRKGLLSANVQVDFIYQVMVCM